MPFCNPWGSFLVLDHIFLDFGSTLAPILVAQGPACLHFGANFPLFLFAREGRFIVLLGWLGWLVGLIDWLVWFVGLGWLVGWSVGLVGWFGWLTGLLVGLFGSLVASLVGLVSWLVG